MAGKIKILYVLAALVVVLQIVDGLTTFLVLSGSPERQDGNPVAALIFDLLGLNSGLPIIKLASVACALWVVCRVKRDQPRSLNMGLTCLFVCSVLMVYAAVNNIIETYRHFYG